MRARVGKRGRSGQSPAGKKEAVRDKHSRERTPCGLAGVCPPAQEPWKPRELRAGGGQAVRLTSHGYSAGGGKRKQESRLRGPEEPGSVKARTREMEREATFQPSQSTARAHVGTGQNGLREREGVSSARGSDFWLQNWGDRRETTPARRHGRGCRRRKTEGKDGSSL